MWFKLTSKTARADIEDRLVRATVLLDDAEAAHRAVASFLGVDSESLAHDVRLLIDRCVQAEQKQVDPSSVFLKANFQLANSENGKMTELIMHPPWAPQIYEILVAGRRIKARFEMYLDPPRGMG